MNEAQAKVKVESNITPDTKIILPLPLQITIIISIVIIPATTVGGYFKMTGSIDKHTEQIQDLDNNKLDKSEYQKDKSVEKVLQEQNSKKLDAIMRKLNIENY